MSLAKACPLDAETWSSYFFTYEKRREIKPQKFIFVLFYINNKNSTILNLKFIFKYISVNVKSFIMLVPKKKILLSKQFLYI